MKYLSSIIVSFMLACSAPVSVAKTDTRNTGIKTGGGYADIHLDYAGG